ncbi:MAG TPA: cyanase [Acidimicrobiia bacterium]|nr:cyanase [Acidimicrobiia bacterium]HZQ76535.1 cyanase [Acidimicrobiia bacterium]
MERTQCTQRILDAKAAKGLTYAEIGGKIGRSEVWTAAAIMGQAQMDASEAEGLCDLLGLEPEVAHTLQAHPMRGSLDTSVPVDPLIYRFHEITQVYGTTIKAVINEKFGEGIMSAIDFELSIDRKEDPKGDRVVVTMDGKFLPFRKW